MDDLSRNQLSLSHDIDPQMNSSSKAVSHVHWVNLCVLFRATEHHIWSLNTWNFIQGWEKHLKEETLWGFCFSFSIHYFSLISVGVEMTEWMPSVFNPAFSKSGKWLGVFTLLNNVIEMMNSKADMFIRFYPRFIKVYGRHLHCTWFLTSE